MNSGVFDYRAIGERYRDQSITEPEPVAPDPHAGEKRLERIWHWQSQLPAGTLIHCEYCPQAPHDCALDCETARQKFTSGDGIDVTYP